MKEQLSNIAPVSRKQRIVSLDVIRGIAVLGILLMNILYFGILNENTARWEALNKLAGGIDFWLVKSINVLFEGKMRALFCILFGTGIMLFIQQKKSASGRSPWGLFYRRMAWLNCDLVRYTSCDKRSGLPISVTEDLPAVGFHECSTIDLGHGVLS